MPWYPAGARLALDCMLGLVAAPTLMAKLHTDLPTAANELAAAAAPGYAPVGRPPGAASWASSADADSGDADNADNIDFPFNTHATDDWPATPHVGFWNAAALVASAPLNVQAPGPGARIRVPIGALDWSIPVA